VNQIWTKVTRITEDDKFLVFHTPTMRLHVPNNGEITQIRKPGSPTPEKPWSKFFLYESLDVNGRNIVTRIENRTVDIIPFCPAERLIYLIRRKDKGGVAGGIALPGGHIDPPETPEDAAYRELSEEVLNDKDVRKCVSSFVQFAEAGWVQEVVAPGKIAAEIHSLTMPFVAVMKPDVELVAGDDAASGQWYEIEDIPWEDFHFLHHVDIIKNWLEHRLPKLTREDFMAIKNKFGYSKEHIDELLRQPE
jgi:ADP-ribose pyrophosphatase YjhB (NUDIX family)